jgi:hypothetical protein
MEYPSHCFMISMIIWFIKNLLSISLCEC